MLLLVGVPTVLAVALLPRRGWRFATARRGARALGRLTGTRLIVNGADHLAGSQPCVVVANHASYLDGFVLAAALPGSYTFVAGEVLAHQVFAGRLLRRIGAEFVDRAEPEQGVADTQRLIEAAQPTRRLVFFPEGGLSPIPGLRPFHLGAFVVAAVTGTPVVPVAIRGTRSMLRPGHRFMRRGVVHVVVGEPILPAGSDWDAAVEAERAARDTILDHCGEPDLRS